MKTTNRWGLIFGKVPPKTTRGFPEGTTKTIIRAGEFVRVTVKEPGELESRVFYVKEVDGHWEPAMELSGDV